MGWLTKYWRFWAFALGSVFLTLWIAGEISGFDPRQGRYGLAATFEDATGLKSGDPVRLSGIEMGQVSSVKVDKGMAVAEFRVNDDIEIPEDSVVAVRSQNIIGIRELVITPGESTRMLAGGDTMENTSSSIELGELINELGPLLDAISPERLNELNAVLVETLAGNREPIKNITSDFSAVLANLSGQRATIEQLIDDYNVILGEVGRRDRQIQQIIDNIVLLSETFSASEDLLVQSLEELPGFADRLAALLRNNAGNLDSIISDLAIVTGTVTDNIENLEQFVTLGGPATAAVVEISNRGQFLSGNFLCLADSGPPCPHPLTDADSLGIDEIIGQSLGLN